MTTVFSDETRQLRADPAGRGGDPSCDLTAVHLGLLGDQRDVPLGVGVTENQAGVRAELLRQPRQLAAPRCAP
jgi:hypothetical protein